MAIIQFYSMLKVAPVDKLEAILKNETKKFQTCAKTIINDTILIFINKQVHF